ncbi:uncharacterized protein Gasu_16290 [Galdieria sulphuraria]|uniref:Uncharacterized protein n=1 Tax=Galdieria sulphuraria TaxID=130081 RepID=M2XLR6_GALSU|nr:uncharacterized protein Gasu_16290 [Galdieria sulphuraria]EME31132.1 hypothetical protein Gasu_16290 [Galdieria sulphuraria]|eukprot:XP_005707652.1 hypothetical protein Gasu_16290 [Galdieria sulphuraria]
MSECKLESNCPWEFVSYRASPIEQAWLTHAAEWGEKPCDYSTEFSDYFLPWLDFIKSSTNKTIEVPVPSAMSRFLFKSTCSPSDTLVVPIEPLFGPLRHPLICNGTDVVDRSYIYIDWQIPLALQSSRARAHYFDIGASTWETGPGAASQNWIVNEFEKRGISFDGIWAWESKFYQSKEVWEQIPAKYLPVYHWFNIPAETDNSSLFNPLNILAQVASEEDFVVLKIDIDDAITENKFMDQIRTNTTLQHLIDEMFFEPHFKMDPLQNSWGPQTTTFEEVITLFTDLRHAGIRIHGWI